MNMKINKRLINHILQAKLKLWENELLEVTNKDKVKFLKE